jgi:hypothetical protein
MSYNDVDVGWPVDMTIHKLEQLAGWAVVGHL